MIFVIYKNDLKIFMNIKNKFILQSYHFIWVDWREKGYRAFIRL